MNNYTRKILRKDVEYSYTDDGKIEVLISPHYGAGWSTWNYEYSINLAIDKRIIDFYKNQKDKTATLSEINKFLNSIGYEDVYCGGWGDIIIKTIPANTKFRINEYDGFESLVIYEEDEIYEL